MGCLDRNTASLKQAAGVVLDAPAHGKHLLNSLCHRGLIALKIAEKVGEPGYRLLQVSRFPSFP